MTMPYPVTVTVDNNVGAAYIELSDHAVANTVEVTPDVQVDVDDMDVVVGIELLSLTANIPIADLVTRFHIHSDVIDVLRQIRPSISSFVATFSAQTGHSSAAMGAIQSFA